MKYLVCFFVVGVSVWMASCEKNKFNGLVDEIIYEMEQNMINKSQTVLKLPEIFDKFSKKILFFTVDGSVNITGGSVKNLSSIYRIGDVLPVQDPTSGSTSFQGTFGMKDLTLHADNIDAKIGFIHIHDPLNLSVKNNAASFKVTLSFDENFNCQAALNYALISKLGGFSISLGSGLMTDIEDDLAEFLMNRLAPTVQQIINAHIFPMVDSAISKLDLCNRLPF